MRAIVSIIVPVYNVDKYLHRCLDSIRSQTLTNLECILVNDASSDNSMSICEEYCAKDNRFKVFHKQKNEGLIKARKTGLNNALADFVIHVDSDDWLEPDALQLLFNAQKENNADIVRARLRHHYNHYFLDSTVSFPFNKQRDSLICFFMNGYNTLCATLYKKCFFDNIITPEISLGEDAIINVQVLSHTRSDKVCYIDDIVYNYDCKTSGLSQSSWQSSYSSFENIPTFKYRLFIEKYLHDSGKNNKDIISAFSYDFISRAIFPYIYSKKKIPKAEINIFYENYWRKCNHKNLFSIKDRTVILACYLSPKLGKFYIRLLQQASKTLKNISKGILCKKPYP